MDGELESGIRPLLEISAISGTLVVSAVVLLEVVALIAIFSTTVISGVLVSSKVVLLEVEAASGIASTAKAPRMASVTATVTSVAVVIASVVAGVTSVDAGFVASIGAGVVASVDAGVVASVAVEVASVVITLTSTIEAAPVRPGANVNNTSSTEAAMHARDAVGKTDDSDMLMRRA